MSLSTAQAQAAVLVTSIGLPDGGRHYYNAGYACWVALFDYWHGPVGADFGRPGESRAEFVRRMAATYPDAPFSVEREWCQTQGLTPLADCRRATESLT